MSQDIKNTSAEVEKKRVKQQIEALYLNEEDLRFGDGAGQYCKIIYVEPGTKVIPDFAFNDTEVDIVYLPLSVERISGRAFKNCTICMLYMRD